MDLYLTALALGGVGLGAMAVTGLGRHGHSGTQGHGHAGGGGHGHAGGGAHATGHLAGHAAAHGHAAGHVHGTGHSATPSQNAGLSLAALMSPRVLFSLALGFGTTGLLLRGVLGGVLLGAAAVAGGVLFDRLFVTPLWNFAFRFASNPALTLESAVTSEATAVSNFDRNGQGLIAVDVDGQVVQVLATLQAGDRELGGKVRAGTKVRIEEVDTARNRCTVSLL